MTAYASPKRRVSSNTAVTVTSAQTWAQTVPVSTYTSLSYSAAGYVSLATATPAVASVAGSINASFSGTSFNPYFGSGGGVLFSGGGHASNNYPFSWVFNAASAAWSGLNVTPPDGVSVGSYQQPNLLYTNGAEFSCVQASMPVGATEFHNYDTYNYWWKPQPNAESFWGYPAVSNNLMVKGEVSFGVPTGWHQYNHMFAIPPNKLGMGANGGWGSVCKPSATRNSGLHVPRGHKIDAASGAWSQMPFRFPGSAQYANGYRVARDSLGQYTSATVSGNYAYHVIGDNCEGIVRCDLTTGVLDAIGTTNTCTSMNQVAFIPGTTILCSLGPQGVAGGDPTYGASVTHRWLIKAADLGAVPASRTWREMIMVNNTLPIGNGDAYQGFGMAGLQWVPEVGKFAVFSTTNPSTEAQCGAWPAQPTLFWITPPSSVQTTWSTGNWTVEEEVLTIPAGDTKANNRGNRGPQGTYGCFHWLSSAKCFVHLPKPATDMCFFIRSNKVP